jgi:hypothetical protein
MNGQERGRFFEKKLRKKLLPWGSGGRCKIPCKDSQMFFCFFFLKKEALF